MRILIFFSLLLSCFQLHAQKPELGTYVVCSFPKEGKPQYNLMLTLQQDSFELAMYEMPAKERYFIPFSRTTKAERQKIRRAGIKEIIRGVWYEDTTSSLPTKYYHDGTLAPNPYYALRANDGRKQSFEISLWSTGELMIFFRGTGFVFNEPYVIQEMMMFCYNN